jgi:ribosome-binding ATPase
VNFDETERKEYLSQLQVTDESCGLPSLVREAYDLLNLHTFYTSGPTETRAWTIKKGSSAPEAAGVIHSDFQKGFIRAEVCPYESYVSVGGETAAKTAGLVRSEGKGYIMQDGDVVLFRFNN